MKTIEELIGQIQDMTRREAAEAVFQSVKANFDNDPASCRNHHKRAGDFRRHVEEVMNIALDHYDLNPSWYDCKRDSVIIVALIHDLDKIDRYKPSMSWQKTRFDQDFTYRDDEIRIGQTAETVWRSGQSGLKLSRKEINAVSFHHGGWSASDSAGFPIHAGDMTPLAVLLHSADMISTVCFGDEGSPGYVSEIVKGRPCLTKIDGPHGTDEESDMPF